MSGETAAVVTWSDRCRHCGTTVEWCTAVREPREAEAPINAAGDVVCDACETGEQARALSQ